MYFVSLTRLRLRSIRFLPLFAVDALRSTSQIRKAAGFERGALLNDRNWTFWTLTVWDSRQNMRQYMTTGSHKVAMPKLMRWCDEASVAHWEQESAETPTWEEAEERMRTTGRPSKVNHPSADHASMEYRAPRMTQGASIVRA
jgi:heme-degrading monooxygenase HmoA